MSKSTTVARPYAKAAFEFGLAANNLGAWSAFLNEASAVVQHERVERYLNAPTVTSEQKAEGFASLLSDINDAQKNFVIILADNKRLEALPQVAELFSLFKDAYEKTIDVDIKTAFALDDTDLANLRESLEKNLNRKVELNSEVDKSLLGGVLIHAGDSVIDASMKGRLEQLEEALSA